MPAPLLITTLKTDSQISSNVSSHCELPRIMGIVSRKDVFVEFFTFSMQQAEQSRLHSPPLKKEILILILINIDIDTNIGR